MKHLSLTIGLASLIGLSTFGSAANAGTLTFSDTVDQTATDFTDVFTISKFDPSLGTLNSIEFELFGVLLGDAAFENRSGSPATITTLIQSTIELQRPDGSLLVQVIPAVTTSTDVSAFDKKNDKGGTSGRTFIGQTDSETNSFVSSASSDFALFTGLGDILLPMSAAGISTATGSGNISQEFDNTAGATVRVVYNFTEPPTPPISIPESSSILGMGVAVAAAGSFASKRRFKQA